MTVPAALTPPPSIHPDPRPRPASEPRSGSRPGPGAGPVVLPARAEPIPAPAPATAFAPLRVVPWEDPAVDAVGVDVRSAYVETFWLPLLGPSTTWLLRQMAAGLRQAPAGYDLDLEEAARALGLGGAVGSRSPFRRAMARCIRYGTARAVGPGALAVRRRLAPVSKRSLERLPPPLRERHRRWAAAAGIGGGAGGGTDDRPARRAAGERALGAERSSGGIEAPGRGWACEDLDGDGDTDGPPGGIATLRRRARSLALDLAAAEPERSAVERRLLHRGVHPALAYESASWARARLDPALPAPTAPVPG